MSGLTLDLLREGFHRAFLFPLGSDITFYAMRAFGYTMALPVVWAALGSASGSALNWFLGNILRRLSTRLSGPHYETLRRYGQWVVLALMLFPWIPFGSLLTLVAGFLRLPAARVLPLLAMGWAGYYCWVAFH